jgi:hypothetical protein
LGVAVALVRARAVGGDKDNSGDSDGGGAFNNQLKGPAEEPTAAATVTATDTARATVTATNTATERVKATEKDEKQRRRRRRRIKDSDKENKPGMYLKARYLSIALALFSVSGIDGEKK